MILNKKQMIIVIFLIILVSLSLISLIKYEINNKNPSNDIIIETDSKIKDTNYKFEPTNYDNIIITNNELKRIINNCNNFALVINNNQYNKIIANDLVIKYQADKIDISYKIATVNDYLGKNTQPATIDLVTDNKYKCLVLYYESSLNPIGLKIDTIVE